MQLFSKRPSALCSLLPTLSSVCSFCHPCFCSLLCSSSSYRLFLALSLCCPSLAVVRLLGWWLSLHGLAVSAITLGYCLLAMHSSALHSSGTQPHFVSGDNTILSVVVKSSKMRSNQEDVRICRGMASACHLDQWMREELLWLCWVSLKGPVTQKSRRGEQKPYLQ